MSEAQKTGVEQKKRINQTKLFYRSHFGVDGDDTTLSFVELFVKWSLLNCSSDARSHKDCNLFPTGIDEPFIAIFWVEETFPLSVFIFTGRRCILVPYETK